MNLPNMTGEFNLDTLLYTSSGKYRTDLPDGTYEWEIECGCTKLSVIAEMLDCGGLDDFGMHTPAKHRIISVTAI